MVEKSSLVEKSVILEAEKRRLKRIKESQKEKISGHYIYSFLETIFIHFWILATLCTLGERKKI